MAQVIINEFRRDGNFQGDEYVELLLTEDLTAAQLQIFFLATQRIQQQLRVSRVGEKELILL
jgi:hypothetical protein